MDLISCDSIIDLGDVKVGTVEFLLPLQNLTDMTVNTSFSFSCGCTTTKGISHLKPNETVDVPIKIVKNAKRAYTVTFTVHAKQGVKIQLKQVQVKFRYV